MRHFNARAHYRTQRAEDLRRGERRSEVFHAVMKEQQMKGAGDGGSGSGARFRLNLAGVVGLLGITFSVVVLSEFSRSTSSDKK